MRGSLDNTHCQWQAGSQVHLPGLSSNHENSATSVLAWLVSLAAPTDTQALITLAQGCHLELP